MATYKVLQDIEAEDKFLGPLTLKQFILGCIFLVSGYLSIFFISKNLWILSIFIFPIMLFAGFLAFPWGRDQPTETWLLAKIRFALKPRRRIWDQTGMKELVTITAPKHLADQYVSNNLSEIEVKSRLKALADTIDSRGWAIKNESVNMVAAPSYGATLPSTDRLIEPSAIAQEVPIVDVNAADDIMDERNNPTAQHLDQILSAASANHKQAAIQQMQSVSDHGHSAKHSHKKTQKDEPPADYWFMNQPPSKLPKDFTTFGVQTVAPSSQDSSSQGQVLTDEERQLLDKRHREQNNLPAEYGNMRFIDPHGKSKGGKDDEKHSSAGRHGKSKSSHQSVTRTPDPAILNLANNDDLSVATLARQANQKPKPEPPHGEVIIPLR